MATHPGALISYDANGDIISCLHSLVQYDAAGGLIGLVDFAGREEAGEDMALYRKDPRAAGAGAWPEWLGSAAADFRVELTGKAGKKGKGSIAALVHKASGHRRERAAIEAAITDRIAKAKGKPADIRDLVGGPDRPIALDKDGRTAERLPMGSPAHLPVLGA
jgi:hypothetical protein